ncbi:MULTISPECIES: hypothetical protein [Vibrio harveyi group]|uniref:Uncharacterized protein n=1 Tax=Vibrio owensii CAIM 1854 = LMG 25443 TaxID=1229493 RepID=A0A0C1ZII9_9VIBR|nr:hypothetical protein [Vibrio owensii]KIF53041.1 hypothetical protein H735_08820 [Vibrio owensii CAIM 1854 = LMG 25443]
MTEQRNLYDSLACLKEDIKTLVLNGEEKVAFELFVEETRKMLGNPAKLPDSYKPRTAEQIKIDLYKELANR